MCDAVRLVPRREVELRFPLIVSANHIHGFDETKTTTTSESHNRKTFRHHPMSDTVLPKQSTHSCDANPI